MKQKYQPFQQRVCVLVKAYPQASKKYEETVCCAGVTEDGKDLLRLYPIRFRRIDPEDRFGRFDMVDMQIFRAKDDHRPESYKVVEGTIKVLHDRKVGVNERPKVWLPFVAESLPDLEQQCRDDKRSLGIIRPDKDSLTFYYKPRKGKKDADSAIEADLYHQNSLFEDELKPLEPPEYSFYYRFTSGGKEFNRQIHDWEVQTAYFQYKRRYGPEALDMLVNEYQNNIPNHNLHFIMGTIFSHPHQFIIIGLLRSSVDVPSLAAQGTLDF